jgi:hypothetical protein
MERYKNLSGDSGILAYEIGAAQITIEFLDGKKYLYDYKKPGKKDVEKMKALAVKGKGLATYINKFVRNRFSKKF